MKLYNTLIKKNNSGKIEDVILLRDEFSLSAFLFSGLWFLYHKMWREFLALIILHYSFSFLGNFWSDFDKGFLEISFLIIVAINANYWFGENLKQKKYEFAGMIFGNNAEEAKLNFINNLIKSPDVAFDDSILNFKSFKK